MQYTIINIVQKAVLYVFKPYDMALRTEFTADRFPVMLPVPFPETVSPVVDVMVKVLWEAVTFTLKLMEKLKANDISLEIQPLYIEYRPKLP